MHWLRLPMAAHSILTILLVIVAASDSAATEKVLYSFTGGADGAFPNGLVSDAAGNLYGTANGRGGADCGFYGCGTAFELSPQANGTWNEMTLYSFQGGPDGANPASSLIFDNHGNLYGTTQGGGSSSCSCGTVFELSPNADGTWSEAVLYSFKGGSDGANPVAGLVFGSAGDLFGTTADGGANVCDLQQNCGTVFELSPVGDGKWAETVLYTFSQSSGDHPESSLIIDPRGNLYGTTSADGLVSGCCGTAFELTLIGGHWQFSTIYVFQGGGEGSYPTAGLVLDDKGDLFGTLEGGGTEGGWGVVFKLRPGSGGLQQDMLYIFCSHNKCPEGGRPSGIASDNRGYFYGTTYYWGESDCGTVFRVAEPRLGWKETTLYAFEQGNGDGCEPTAGVTFGPDGNIYGTTSGGGANTYYGTIFEITLPARNP